MFNRSYRKESYQDVWIINKWLSGRHYDESMPKRQNQDKAVIEEDMKRY